MWLVIKSWRNNKTACADPKKFSQWGGSYLLIIISLLWRGVLGTFLVIIQCEFNKFEFPPPLDPYMDRVIIQLLYLGSFVYTCKALKNLFPVLNLFLIGKNDLRQIGFNQEWKILRVDALNVFFVDSCQIVVFPLGFLEFQK